MNAAAVRRRLHLSGGHPNEVVKNAGTGERDTMGTRHSENEIQTNEIQAGKVQAYRQTGVPSWLH